MVLRGYLILIYYIINSFYIGNIKKVYMSKN